MSQPKLGLRPETRDLVRWAEERGWTVTKTAGSHLRFARPGCGVVFGSSTPSDHRSVLNIRKKLERSERQGGVA